jgi:hypothetical protein
LHSDVLRCEIVELETLCADLVPVIVDNQAGGAITKAA